MSQFIINTSGIVTLTDLGNRILPSGLTGTDIGTEFKIEELRYSSDLAAAISAGTLEVTDDGRGRSIVGPIALATAEAFVDDIYHFDDTDVTDVIATTVLNDLSDINITTPSDGEALVYNNATGDWENQAVVGGVTSVNGDTGAVVLDTDDIAEGITNLYYTQARFDSAFTAKSTTDLSEGTNLYYTDTRARAALSIAAGSTDYLGYNSGTGELSVTALALTTVIVEGTQTSLANWVAANYTVGTEFQEGDVIVLTAATGGTETYIHNGGTAVSTADWSLIQQPNVDQTTVRTWFSATAPLSYNSGTGVFSLDLKANGGLVVESNELALDLGATSITGTLAIGDGGTGLTTYAQGDIIYADNANSLSTLAAGSDGQVLTMGATVPEWADIPASKKTWSWGAASDGNVTTNRYLNRHDATPTNLSGYVAWYDCELKAISANSDDTDTWTAEVHVNGSSVGTLSITSATSGFTTGLSVSITAGDVISFYCNGTSVGQPSIDALFEEV